MGSLYKMCAGHTMFPRSLYLELPGDVMRGVGYVSGFSDVFRCKCGDREVVVKALRQEGLSSQKVRNVSQNLRVSLVYRSTEHVL